MQHDDGRRRVRRRADHAIFEIAVADAEEAGGRESHLRLRACTALVLPSPLRGGVGGGGVTRTPIAGTPLPNPPPHPPSPEGGLRRTRAGRERRSKWPRIMTSPRHHPAACSAGSFRS